MKPNNPNYKSNWQLFWENFVNRVLIVALWIIIPIALFLLLVFLTHCCC